MWRFEFEKMQADLIAAAAAEKTTLLEEELVAERAISKEAVL
jgi:hypothetical protein